MSIYMRTSNGGAEYLRRTSSSTGCGSHRQLAYLSLLLGQVALIFASENSQPLELPQELLEHFTPLGVLSTTITEASKELRNDPDFGKSPRQLAELKGYPFEGHRVVTDDGVILTVHRIPYGRNQRSKSGIPNKDVVFLPAPLFCSSPFYIDDLANNSIGFILADAGFDVWLGNTRGTIYGSETISQGRITDRRDRKFYNYTLVEHGVFDVAAQIDYILRHTNVPKLAYFAHSQGSASGFALLSKRPEYNSHISAFASLGGFRTFACPINQVPPAIWRPIKLFISGFRATSEVFDLTSMTRLCKSYWPVCQQVLSTFLYGDAQHSNLTRIPLYLEHYPQPTSVKNLIYLAQLYQRACRGDKRAVEFNYDEVLHESADQLWFDTGLYGNNAQVYGKSAVPELPVENIRVPVKVYYSDGDTLITPSNQRDLIAELPRVVGVYHIADPGFVHGNFAHSPYNMSHVYDVIEFFRAYKDNNLPPKNVDSQQE